LREKILQGMRNAARRGLRIVRGAALVGDEKFCGECGASGQC
jgi:hypothetical protein